MNMVDKEKEGIIYQYLKSQYSGVFSDKQVRKHIKDYIGCDIAEEQVSYVLNRKGVKRILDIGSVLGSFLKRIHLG